MSLFHHILAFPPHSVNDSAPPLAFWLPRALFADFSNLPWVAIIAVGGSLLVGPLVLFIVFRTAQSGTPARNRPHRLGKRPAAAADA